MWHPLVVDSVQRKEKEAAAIGAKIEDEATLGSKYSKQTKELQSRLEELDEELSIERGNRAKAEKSRAMLKKDLEDLGSRLEEAGANTATQVELNKKREGELARSCTACARPSRRRRRPSWRRPFGTRTLPCGTFPVSWPGRGSRCASCSADF